MEGTELKKIQLKVCERPGIRLFRNNVGTGWQGRQKWNGQKELTLGNPRPLKAGLCEGSSDLIGWVTVEITPEMVGQKVAVFTAIEYKTPNTGTSTAQGKFLAAVRAAGGRCGIARNVPDAVQICTQYEINP